LKKIVKLICKMEIINKKGNIYLTPSKEEVKVGDVVVSKFKEMHILTVNDSKSYAKTTVKQNIYVTSDEKIKEGDYTIYFDIWLCKILKHYGDQVLILKLKDNTETTVLIPEHKKIIATNDTSLFYTEQGILNHSTAEQDILPQPSQQFIEDFIKEYNNKNIITKVDIKYKKVPCDSKGEPIKGIFLKHISDPSISSEKCINQMASMFKETLLIEPHDNTIEIDFKSSQRKYSEKEVIALLHKYEKDMIYYGRDGYYSSAFPEATDNWAKENLK